MTYSPSAYPHGTFSWMDVASKDIAAAKRFYESLFGWTSEDMPTGEGRPDYTMFSLEGKYTAGGSPAWDQSMPSYWSSYISVDDVDVAAAKAESLGAKIVMPTMDVLDSGRMAGIEDPTGATVFLWQPKSHIGAGIVNVPGAMAWNELYTPDLEKAKAFYAQLLGWTYEADATGYVTIFNSGRRNGGMMAISPEMQGMPPMWIPYVHVADMSAALAKTAVLGGAVHLPAKEVEVGKIAMIADPSGASLMLIQMSVEPDHWEE